MTWAGIWSKKEVAVVDVKPLRIRFHRLAKPGKVGARSDIAPRKKA